MLKKGAVFSTLVNYQNILKTLENNLQTNLTFDDIYDMQQKYKEAVSNISQIQLQGTGQMIDGISYQIVSREELMRVSELLRKDL